MERLTTHSDSQGTCLTLCYQSLPVSHIGVDNSAAQITLEADSPTSLVHLAADGASGSGIPQLRMDSSTLSVDNQVSVAVQSLLESQAQETPVEEEDVFQCGRCKKQFTSLTAFLTHKQTHCAPAAATSTHVTQLQLQAVDEPQQPLHHHFQQLQMETGKTQAQPSLSLSIATSQPSFSTQAGQSLTTYTTLPASPLSQLQQGVVLSDDLMTFTANIDPAALQGSTIQMVTAPFTSRSSSSNSVTILGTVQPAVSFTTASTTPTFHQQQQAAQALSQHLTSLTAQQGRTQLQAPQTCSATGLTTFSQQVLQTLTPQAQTMTIALPEIKQPVIIRRTTTKASRKSSQSQAAAANATSSSTSSGRGRRAASSGDESGKKNLQCQYCNKLFTKNFDLQQHIRAHTGEKPFQCIVCGRAFAQKSNVKKHMATHKVWPSGTSATLPKQPSPQAVLQPEEEQEESTQNSSDGQPLEDCVQLVEAAVTGVEEEGVVIIVNNLQELGEQQHAEKEEQDEDIAKDQLEGELESQLKPIKVKVVVDNSYICQYCSEKFKTFFQLKTHMIKHKSEQVYKCVMRKCGQSFKELESFLEHTKTHENEMSYRCHLCNKYFPSLYDLGCHQYTHNLYPIQGMKSGPRHFQCVKCGNKYTTPEALEHHLSTTSHQYPCPHCSKLFSCERFLRRHLPIHGTEGQFECPTCQKRFKTEHYLKLHMLIHSGEKPYQCDTCQASFNRKDKLKRHMTVHDSVKKFRCPFKTLTGCLKEFNRPDKLKCHIITHSGIKPYKCGVCGKAFSRRPHMLEHERGHKSDYRFKCEKCGRGFFRCKLFNEHRCHPGRANYTRRRRKIGRPRKRDFLLSQDSTGSEEMTVVEVKRLQPAQGTRGLRSASGIRLQNARVAAAIASQIKGSRRSSQANKVVVETSVEDSTDKIDNPLDEELETSAHLTDFSSLSDKHLQQVLPGELEGSQVIDHYVVHLADCGDGILPTIHATISPAALQAGLAAGTLQPITIIEATPVSLSGMIEAALPMVTVSHGGEVMATQVVVASAPPSHSQLSTFVSVACPTQLVDFSTGDSILHGADSLLKASADILQTVQSEVNSLPSV